MVTGGYETLAYPDFARVGQYVPPLVADEAHSESDLGTDRNAAFPACLSIRLCSESGDLRTPFHGFYRRAGDTHCRMAIWRNQRAIVEDVLDTQSGLILKLHEFGRDGSGVIEGERTVTGIVFNPAFEASTFTLPSGIQQAAVPTQTGSQPVVTAPGRLQPRTRENCISSCSRAAPAGGSSWRGVSGICVLEGANCPPMQVVTVPFAFTLRSTP